MEFTMAKLAIYVFSAIIVVWSMDAVNINGIFKKNQVLKARVFYFVLMLCLIYLLSSFLYDFIYIKIF